MIILSEDHNASTPPDLPGKQHRKIIFSACLVLSLTIHLVTISIVLLATPSRKNATVVTYFDVSDIASVIPNQRVVIQAPAPPLERKPSTVTTETSPSSENLVDISKSATTAPPEAPAVPEILETPLGRGMTSGYFTTLAEGRTLREDIREYYFQLLDKINNQWWEKAATLKDAAQQDGIVEILIGRDGTLYDLRLLRSSGSREVDRAIIETLRNGTPFPALPDSYEMDMFRAPLRIATPLHLFNVRRR